MAEINEIQVGQDVFNIGGSGGGVNYSTTEQDTGLKWIDGKPIYQKTINCGALPNSTSKNVIHGISNFDYVVNFYGVAKRSTDNTCIGLPYANSDNISNIIEVYITSTNVFIKTNSDKTKYTSSYVTILYTKTTDTPS